MPKAVEKCVKALMADPNFKPKPGSTKEQSAWAVCVAMHNRKTKKNLVIHLLNKLSVDFDLRKNDVKELVADHYYLHSGWSLLKTNGAWGEWTREELSEYHAKVVDVLRSKGYMMFPKNNSLDEESKKSEETSKQLMPSDIPSLLQPGGITIFQSSGKREKDHDLENELELFDIDKIFKSLNELRATVQISEYVCLVSSSLRSDKEPDDIDIIIRSSGKNDILERKISAQFPEVLKERLHFIYEPVGPTSSYVPLFDLVLMPADLRKVKIENSESEKIDEH